mmetsp:Transcript_14247/g.21532  ORF Transcript_14247/g.21532 Transcript_14247/m.21532 type:complete len:313 (-) Transcript_14247:14-952(-)
MAEIKKKATKKNKKRDSSKKEAKTLTYWEHVCHSLYTFFWGESSEPINASVSRKIESRLQRNRSKKKTLILDLDETLIHTSLKPTKYGKNIILEFYEEKDIIRFNVSVRPHLHTFLNTIQQWYKVVVFTAGTKDYADAVIDQIDPSGIIEERYYRDSCDGRKIRLDPNSSRALTDTNKQVYLKNIAKIQPDLSQCILVDNNPYSVITQINNGIICKSWFGNKRNDCELLNILPLLEALRGVDDVRSVILRQPIIDQQLLLKRLQTPPKSRSSSRKRQKRAYTPQAGSKLASKNMLNRLTTQVTEDDDSHFKA